MLTLSRRISIAFSIPIILFGTVLLAISYNVMQHHFDEDRQRWGQTIVSSLSEGIVEEVINLETVQVNQVLQRVLSQNTQLAYIYVIDFEGRLSASTFSHGVPRTFLESFDSKQQSRAYTLNNEKIEEIWEPLIEGLPGRVHIGFYTASSEQFIRDALLISASSFVLVILATVFLGKRYGNQIGRPLERLSSEFHKVGTDSVEVELVSDSGISEINNVIENFNQMAKERRVYIAELLRGRESLNRAQEIAHVGNWDWNIADGSLAWSDEVYRIFGLAPHQFGATYEAFLERVHEADRQAVIEAVNDALAEPDKEYRIEHRISRPDGEIRWVLEKGQVTFQHQIPVYMMGIVFDITEQKKADLIVRAYQEELQIKVKERTMELSQANNKLLQLDRLKSMFIASMSHELRTPLNSIIGFSSVMLKGMTGELNPKQKDQLNRVYSSATHLLDLISDIIDISKIEAGRVDVNRETFSLSEFMPELVGQVKPIFDTKKLVFIEEIEPGIVITTDRLRLHQVLSNILSNAGKYTDQGHVKLRVTRQGDYVEFQVEDSGVGISQQDQARLFEPFERIENRLTVKSGGTGLGLYLVKKLLDEVLQGTVHVRSELGRGSVFSILLPLTIVIADAGKTQKSVAS